MYNCFNAETYVQRFFRISGLPSNLDSLLYIEGKTVLTDRFIQQYERLSTQSHIRLEMPFLDLEIVEFLAHLPQDCKCPPGENSTPLKRLLSESFPPEFLTRTKNTRKHLLTSWLEHPATRKALYLMKDSALVDSGYISGKWLQKAIASPTHYFRDFTRFWSLLSLEVWYRQFINQPININSRHLSLEQTLRK